MNAQTPIARELTIDDAHLLRSKLIDKSSAFEMQVYRVAALSGVKLPTKMSLGQRIEALQSALNSKVQRDKNDNRIIQILSDAEPHMALRNELAHGAMTVALVDGKSQIVVCNANRSLDYVQLYAILTDCQLVDAARKLHDLAHRLSQIAEPKTPNPPAPHPPKPAATTGL